MSESKHTPGPLAAHKQPEGDIIDHAYSILTHGEECRCVALINLDVGTFADLRLWASAPDLLEALKEAREVVEGDIETGPMEDEASLHARALLVKIDAAIAKATGGRDE